MARAAWRRIHSWEGEEQLCGELSACNLCAALEKVSFGKQGLTLDLQTFGGKRECRWGAGAGITGDGGGTTSEAWGSWKVRFNSARPPGSASSRKVASRPCFQKFATWEN